jgi:hypothetical protein
MQLGQHADAHPVLGLGIDGARQRLAGKAQALVQRIGDFDDSHAGTIYDSYTYTTVNPSAAFCRAGSAHHRGLVDSQELRRHALGPAAADLDAHQRPAPRSSVAPSLARRSWKRRSIVSLPSLAVSQVPSTRASPSKDGSR